LHLLDYEHYTYYVFPFVGETSYSAHIVGGGGQHGGFDALDDRKIEHGDAGKSGNYSILSVLPDKFARFLYEFHDYRFLSLDLPPLPADRSDFDVHGALEDPQVTQNVYIY
jgi:hypothetical protein